MSLPVPSLHGQRCTLAVCVVLPHYPLIYTLIYALTLSHTLLFFFSAGVAGLLTNRLSLVYSEVLSQMTKSDWLGFLPGSFAEAMRQADAAGVGRLAGAAEAEVAPRTPLVLLTGPAAGGRTAVASRLRALAESAASSSSSSSSAGGAGPRQSSVKGALQLKPLRLVTPDAALAESDPDRWVTRNSICRLGESSAIKCY